MAALKKLDVVDLVKAALAIDLPPRAPGHYGFGVPVQNYQQYSDVVKVTVVRLWACQSYGDVKEIRRLQLVRHAAAALTREDRVLFERDFYYRHEEAKAFVKKGNATADTIGLVDLDGNEHALPPTPGRLFKFMKRMVNEELAGNPTSMPKISAEFFGRELDKFHDRTTRYQTAKEKGKRAFAKFLADEGIKTEKAYRSNEKLTDELLDDYYKFHTDKQREAYKAECTARQEAIHQRQLVKRQTRARTCISRERILDNRGKALLTDAVANDEQFLSKYLRITTAYSFLMRGKDRDRREEKLADLLIELLDRQEGGGHEKQ